jgi:hypothetical protein
VGKCRRVSRGKWGRVNDGKRRKGYGWEMRGELRVGKGIRVTWGMVKGGKRHKGYMVNGHP